MDLSNIGVFQPTVACSNYVRKFSGALTDMATNSICPRFFLDGQYMKLTIIAALILFIPKTLWSQASKSPLILYAIPYLKCESDENGGTQRWWMSEDEMVEYATTVTKVKGKYYWASRQNRPLTLYNTSDSYVFKADKGAGYIRLFKKPHGEMPDAKLVIVHIPIGKKIQTYWASTGTFVP